MRRYSWHSCDEIGQHKSNEHGDRVPQGVRCCGTDTDYQYATIILITTEMVKLHLDGRLVVRGNKSIKREAGQVVAFRTAY